MISSSRRGLGGGGSRHPVLQSSSVGSTKVNTVKGPEYVVLLVVHEKEDEGEEKGGEPDVPAVVVALARPHSAVDHLRYSNSLSVQKSRPAIFLSASTSQEQSSIP